MRLLAQYQSLWRSDAGLKYAEMRCCSTIPMEKDYTFDGVKPSRFGGYQMLLASPRTFQTPKSTVQYGTDGKYASLSLFVDDKFADVWMDMENNMLAMAAHALSEKFGDEFGILDYYRSSVRRSIDQLINMGHAENTSALCSGLQWQNKYTIL